MLQLSLKNYRRFLEDSNGDDGFHRIAFGPGLTIITGPNGAGKTSLVESLSYGLYGPRRGQKKDVLPDNAVGETEVICELEIDGQPVKVHRWSNRAELWVNDALQIQGLPGSLSDVNRQLGALLGGLAPEQFEHTYFAQQGDTAGLVEATDSARRGTIAQILQLDVLEMAIKLQAERRNGSLQQVKTQGRSASDELQFGTEERELLESFERARTAEKQREHMSLFQGRVQAAVTNRQEKAKEANEALGEARLAAKQLEELRGEHENERDQAQAKVRAHEQLKEENDEIEQVIRTKRALREKAMEQAGTLRARIQHAEECEEAARLYRSLQENVAVCDQRLNRLPVVKERYERLSKAQGKLRDLESRLEQLEDADQALALAMENEVTKKTLWQQLEADPTRGAFEVWQARKAALDLQEGLARKAVETLREISEDAPCPTCNHPLSQHKREERLRHLRTWLDQELPRQRLELHQDKEGIARRQEAWKNKRAQAHKAWDKAHEAVTEARQQVYEWNSLKQQRDNATLDLRAARQAWDDLEEERPYDSAEEQRMKRKRQGLAAQALKLKEDADLFSRLTEFRKELQDKEVEIGGYTREIEKHQASQSEIGYDPAAHEATKRALSAAEETLSDTKEELQKAQLEVAGRRAIAQQETEAAERAKRVQSQLEEDVTEFQHDDRLLFVLEDFLNYFFEANTKRVSQRASELTLHAVIDGSILGVEFDEQGRLYYLDASYARRLVTKTRPSGGEKALIGLCLRIALAEQAQSIARTGKLRFLVLDEVLSSLDDERRDAVEQIFEDVQQRGVFEHIIMITHLDAVKQGWRANGLEVRKVGTKESKVAPVKMGEAVSDLAEEYEEV